MTALVEAQVLGPQAHNSRRARRSRPRRLGLIPTIVLLIGAAYTLVPVLWVVIAATKDRSKLFSTFTLAPSFGSGMADNVRAMLTYENGLYLTWARNSLLYAGAGSLLAVAFSAMAGYGLAKYRFRGRNIMFGILLASVLIPQITLAIPQYLLMAKADLSNTYWAVLLPSVVYPYGIYLCRIYAAAAVPDEMLEAGRLDGASEWRMFRSIGLPVMFPGLITVFLVAFVSNWNNFLLPFIMLSDQDKYPITVGLYTLLSQGVDQPVLYSIIIAGAMMSIIPLVVLFLVLQRYWRMDLLSGGVKG
ncbi:MAG: carbohydrate ABC transporter permease [Mycobacteriales bacterium]